MLAAKLQKGDEVRVVAPARSLTVIEQRNQQTAVECLRDELGLKVSFGQAVNEADVFNSATIQSRVADLHEAFQDPNVKAILSVIGGFNSNQLLPYLDYQLIQANPKIICGFSDITALTTAIYAKTGLITYSGMHFSSFGMVKNREYQIQAFKNCLFSNDSFAIEASAFWSDDEWYLDQEQRRLVENTGMKVLHQGVAEAAVIGGNLEVLNLLQGTPYMPSLENKILFLEDLSTPEIFDCNLESLLQQKAAETIQGLVIGRFQDRFQMTSEKKS